ncbi:MAG: copper chaperone [Caproiciproducens sp.]|jgi:copper ion binding protein|nr:copper chaperone [Caproiciproducens sp.]
MSKTSKTLDVNGMSCSNCEHAVKKSVGALSGVDHISVDLRKNQVMVEYDSDKVELEQIKQAIQDQGYGVV